MVIRSELKVMCFSATVSFTSSAFLAANSVIGTYFAIQANKRFLPMNMMAFFFAIQQFSEGMIWLGSPFFMPNTWGMIFLFFAFFVYPWYQSFACYWITRDKKRQHKIFWVGCYAFIFGALLFLNVLMTPDLGLDHSHLHIFYDVLILGKYHYESHFLIDTITPMYIFAVTAPYFLSDAKYSSLLGWVILISAVLCWFIYFEYFVSVWCFYAAIVSVCIAVYSYYEWYKHKRKLVKQMNRPL